MSELVLMPTPNWFTSRPIDICQETGTIAFSAICSILLTDNLINTYNSTIREAHAKRILCLSFYKGLPRSDDETLLASCSEDLEVKIWNSKSKALVSQHKLHQNIPVSVDWLKLSDSSEPILISCDIKGNIFKYSLATSLHCRYFPENKPISQLKTCPNSFLVAVGYKQGTIVILDVKNEQMKIIHKLKNHDDTINCLSWFPNKNINIEQEDITELLKCKWDTSELGQILCSSSEDKTIRMWCVDKGEEVQCVKAPGTAASSSKSSGEKRLSNIAFTPMCWPDSRYLVSGSFKGELSYYDLLGSETQWHPFISPDKSHKKIIYEIASFKDKIITLSLDRLVNVWDMVSFKQESSMSTLNGYVYSIVSSPIDPNVMAVSVGDSSIKLLNEKLHKKITKNLTNNIKSEVTQIAWHPTKENILAFGTKEGKVGIIDTMANNKSAQYIYSNFNQSVYTLVWSSPIIQLEPVTPKPQDNRSELAWRSSKPSKSSSYALYSVADGKIIQHNMQFLGSGSGGMIVNSNYKSLNLYNKILEDYDPNNEAKQGTEALSKANLEYGLTEFSVLMPDKSDQDQGTVYFIIGKFDGSMEIFKKSLHVNNVAITKLCTFFNHQKLVTCSKWNNRKNLIASGSNDYSVIVLDFESLLEEIKVKFEGQSDLKFYSKFKHKLVGHRERITGMSWSSYEAFNMLASCSYDATVQIWNADEGTPLANYRGHSEKILCCLFSNTDLNTVFSGGEDYSLHKWRIDAQTNILPPEECSIVLKKKNRAAKKNQANKKPEQAESKRTDTEVEIDLTEVEDETTSQRIDLKKEEELVKKPAKSSSQRELKSLLMLSSHGNKSQKSKIKDCLSLFEILYEGQQQKVKNISQNNSNDFEFHLRDFEIPAEQINLYSFGNRSSVIKMVELEHVELKRLNSDKWYILDVWRGNLAKVFHEFYGQNNLNDIIFNLYQISVSSNPNTLEFLTEYIDQLSKNSSSYNEKIHKAVLYSLASFDVHKALEIYVANNLYLYALTLAQLRLAPTDPYLNIILNKYGVFATMNGDYETGVMCYMRSGDFENAYKVLIRRNVKGDVESEVLIKNLLEKIADLMPGNSEINII